MNLFGLKSRIILKKIFKREPEEVEVLPIPEFSCDGEDCGVMEFYCDYSVQIEDFFVAFTDSRCANGCMDGACIPPPCSDSDDGINYTIRGNSTGLDGHDYSGKLMRDLHKFKQSGAPLISGPHAFRTPSGSV